MTRAAKSAAPVALTLGPVLFNWPPERLRDFYFRIADEAPYERVVLGEVVCSKRAPFFAPHWPEVAARLARAGKEVVHASLALIAGPRESAMLRELVATAGRFVEANDIAAHALLAPRAHAIGPFVNVYNEATLAWLANNGARRVCLPPELPAKSIGALGAADLAELEVQVFGRLPLALSARCYHARAHDLRKDNCRFVCEADPDGLEIETLDGEPFLAVNGTQTLSHGFANLIGELDRLRGLGVASFRLSPHDLDMVAVAGLFRDVLDRRRSPAAATARLARLIGPRRFCNGYFHGDAGAARHGLLAAGEVE